MSENRIKVSASTTSKAVRVNVSAPTSQGAVTLSQDTSAYNAKIAEQWAVSENLVLGQDYSSKYYAKQAKESASNAKGFEQATREAYEIVSESVNRAVSNVEEARDEAIESIDSIKEEAVENVISAKTTILNDIEFVADGEKKEIEDLADLIKENAEEIASRTSFAMFDTVLKDHVLTYEESKGLALQGTYVYKNAVAGSRYGYADFYNKCLEEFQNSQVTANIPNVNITGTLKCVNGILSGFNASARADVPTEFDPSSYSWEMVFKVKTGSDITTNNDIASGYDYAFVIRINSGKLRLYLSTDGTSWNLASAISGTYALSTNTEYYVKLEFTGTNYILSISTNGIEYTQDINVAGTGLITPGIMTIGCRATTSGTSVPFLGSIDLNESYININGERWWNGGLAYKNPNGHLFYDITQKDIVDDLFEQTGMAWFYGIDTKNERIFLPRNNYFEQVTGDVSEVGQSIEAGLPDHIHDLTMDSGYGGNSGGANTRFEGGDRTNGTTTATTKGASNSIYGNSDTVQPNAVKKLLYICVGNTVSDTSWVDVVTQVRGGVKDIEEAKDEAVDAIKNAIGGTVPLGFIGFAALGIDETLGLQRYLNGQIIIQDQFKGFTKFLKRRIELYPSLACTEDEWQTTVTMSAFSQCGKFVIDDNAGTIRLPKVVNIQGLTDLSKLGEIVKAGLPNITGALDTTGSKGNDQRSSTSNGEGCLSSRNSKSAFNYGTSGTANQTTGISFDASKSNQIYGNSNTVQQEQIQYPYFIQVATGAETEDNIINEIELNNPFSLLDYKYSEYELNNLSWLRSNGQYNSKAIYPAVYDLLLKIYNGVETKAGVSVKLTSETFTDYDFVLNTAEETFRLPIKVKLASGKAVVGNGIALGVTNGEQTAAMVAADINNYWGALRASGSGTAGTSIGTSISTTTSLFKNGTAVGVTTDPTKSGIETSDSGLYLYFYVGETVQNANLINAGRIEEKVANLIPNNSSLITNYLIPDYTTKISTATSGYVCPYNCLIIARSTHANRNADDNLSINGVSVATIRDQIYNTSTSADLTVPLFASKGDVITWTGDATIFVYKLKGDM